MQEALNKVTIPLLSSIKSGEEVELTDGYVLYRYHDDDVIVFGKDFDGYFAEILAVLYDDFNVEYHVLNEEFI